jgi:hypothetical protein
VTPTADSGATTTPASAGLIDFDAILASLGAPDASPPPMMEMLVPEPPRAAPVIEPGEPVAVTTCDPTAEVLQELESWLHVLQRDEHASTIKG